MGWPRGVLTDQCSFSVFFIALWRTYLEDKAQCVQVQARNSEVRLIHKRSRFQEIEVTIR
jgi:hypothetical protein